MSDRESHGTTNSVTSAQSPSRVKTQQRSHDHKHHDHDHESDGHVGASHAKHELNSFASATPATDGKRVFALFASDQDFLVVAYDFAGRQIWKRDLGCMDLLICAYIYNQLT